MHGSLLSIALFTQAFQSGQVLAHCCQGLVTHIQTHVIAICHQQPPACLVVPRSATNQHLDVDMMLWGKALECDACLSPSKRAGVPLHAAVVITFCGVALCISTPQQNSLHVCSDRRAKEKRERLRSAHLAPDYLPLGGAERLTSQRAEPEGPKAAEQDSASDEDDLDMRMRFVGWDAPKPVLPVHDADAQVGCIGFSHASKCIQADILCLNGYVLKHQCLCVIRILSRVAFCSVPLGETSLSGSGYLWWNHAWPGASMAMCFQSRVRGSILLFRAQVTVLGLCRLLTTPCTCTWA